MLGGTVLTPRLAGLVSAALLAASQGSCLATSADDFPDPPSTPPFLNGSRAAPPLSQVLLVDPVTASPIIFSAYVRSEDAGADLEARLVADWPDTLKTLQITQLGTGTFSGERLVSLTWDPRAPALNGRPLDPGCYPISLVVTHRFNPLTNIPARLDDADFLVWWVFVADPTNPDGLAAFDVSTCPNPRRLPAVEASP